MVVHHGVFVLCQVSVLYSELCAYCDGTRIVCRGVPCTVASVTRLHLSICPHGYGHLHKVAVLVFSEVSRLDYKAQLCYFEAFLVCEMKDAYIFCLLSWSSNKSRRPVKFIGSAEVSAACEGIDEGLMLPCTLSAVYDTTVPLVIDLDGH